LSEDITPKKGVMSNPQTQEDDMQNVRKLAAVGGTIAALGFAAPAMADEPSDSGLGSITSAIENVTTEIQDLNAITDLSAEDIQVSEVGDVANGSSALNENDLQALNDNQVVKDVLDAHDLDVSDVVGVDVDNEGDVTLLTE
jgi:hypothetical protein